MTADAETSNAPSGQASTVPAEATAAEGPLFCGEGPVSARECRIVLDKMPQFHSLTAADLDALVPLMKAHDYTAGSTLFYEDDDSDAVFFIAGGAIEVFKSNLSGKKMPLVVLRAGGVLGEIGVLSGERRTATARALNAARVLELPRDAFEAALADGNLAAYRLTLAFARVLSVRLSTTDEKLFELFQNDVSDLLYKQLSELQSRLLTRWSE